jgi:hypothetical protein
MHNTFIHAYRHAHKLSSSYQQLSCGLCIIEESSYRSVKSKILGNLFSTTSICGFSVSTNTKNLCVSVKESYTNSSKVIKKKQKNGNMLFFVVFPFRRFTTTFAVVFLCEVLTVVAANFSQAEQHGRCACACRLCIDVHISNEEPHLYELSFVQFQQLPPDPSPLVEEHYILAHCESTDAFPFTFAQAMHANLSYCNVWSFADVCGFCRGVGKKKIRKSSSMETYDCIDQANSVLRCPWS